MMAAAAEKTAHKGGEYRSSEFAYVHDRSPFLASLTPTPLCPHPRGRKMVGTIMTALTRSAEMPLQGITAARLCLASGLVRTWSSCPSSRQTHS
jgi:hypothetical protein